MDLEDGRWYPWKKTDLHECCTCGLKHTVDIRVDRRGVVWMRWEQVG